LVQIEEDNPETLPFRLLYPFQLFPLQSIYLSADNCDDPGALAARSVPPTTANGSMKLDKNGIAKRNVNVAPKPVQA
jgi:hypothetical protein